MGDKILKSFHIIREEGGLYERMRVSMVATIPSAQASTLPDSPENLLKMQNAIREVLANNTSVMYKAINALK